MATVEVILTEKIKGLGQEADVVKVRGGYARNFLFPQGKAYEATRSNLSSLAALKKKRAEREAAELNAAEALAAKIKKIKATLEIATGETGKAFGSITNQDIHQHLIEKLESDAIDRHSIALEKPIKNTGDFEIEIKLHPEVNATLKLKVVASSQSEETTAEEDKG